MRVRAYIIVEPQDRTQFADDGDSNADPRDAAPSDDSYDDGN